MVVPRLDIVPIIIIHIIITVTVLIEQQAKWMIGPKCKNIFIHAWPKSCSEAEICSA